MKFLSLEGLAYLYQKLKAKFDSLSSISHTHENKDTLDGITKNSWAEVKGQAHSHNNIACLSSISPANITALQETFPKEIGELQQSFKDMQSAATVYVNIASGSDDNDGSTAATAFATLGKALNSEAVKFAKKAIIRLVAGTYTIPNKEITFTSAYISLIGNSASDTVIKGNINLDNNFLNMLNVTINCTDTEYANTSATAPIRVLSNSKVCLENVNLLTVTSYCVAATQSSNVYCKGCSFSGNSSYAVLLTGDSSATIYRCNDTSKKGLESSYGCKAYLISSPDFSYKSTYYGLVYVDGQQVLPQTAETAAVLSMGGNV